jgi:hypothetical protein
MFGYDTTPNFIAGVAVAQIFNFAICARYEDPVGPYV